MYAEWIRIDRLECEVQVEVEEFSFQEEEEQIVGKLGTKGCTQQQQSKLKISIICAFF